MFNCNQRRNDNYFTTIDATSASGTQRTGYVVIGSALSEQQKLINGFILIRPGYTQDSCDPGIEVSPIV